jgi:hypothetical protein
VNHYQTATDADTIELRTLVEGSGDVLAAGEGKMFADYDPDNQTAPPYIAVSDHQGSRSIYHAFDHSSEVDETSIQFAVFAKSRAQVVGILDQLEIVYGAALLHTDDWEVLDKPLSEMRRTFWGLDQWGGLLEMVFTTQS